MPKTLDEFQQIKYNKNKAQEFQQLKEIRDQEKDYKIAAEGGTHSGKLRDYQSNYSVSGLKKSIRNLEKKIATHLDKIANPENYYADWLDSDEKKKQGRIKHWEKEIEDFKKEKNIAIAELRRRNSHD